MKERRKVLWQILLLVSLSSCNGQNHPEKQQHISNQVAGELSTPTDVIIDTLFVNNAPNNITRAMVQDKSGDIWLATFGGLFKYDGNSFTNILKEGSFFSILKDSNGNLWFGAIGSGVYLYNGEFFQNFTTDDGLVNNEIVCIYEDKMGNIWLGANGGVSRYDGKSFRNYVINGDTISEDSTGYVIPNLQRPINEVNTIIEDKTGKLWLGTRNKTFTYDGKSFTAVAQNGKPFTNVRWIIEDKKENIWLGGNEGLWRYNGTNFRPIAEGFVGYIYEDKHGNIWTSAQLSGNDWVLSRYENTTLGIEQQTRTIIKSGEGMFFGILEDADGNIWAGTLNGVCLYDGKNFHYLREKL
ncbi:MAG: two-component regulator propeller domain-containing protein [Saprospiraceae bacterium]